MTTRSHWIEVEYELPEIDTLAEQFAAAAEISADGNTVRIGDYTALRSRGWFGLSETWDIKHPGATWKDTLSFKFTGANIAEAQKAIIDFCAAEQANKSITPDMEKVALKKALEAKVNTL